MGLFEGQTLVVLERFDPDLVLSAIEAYGVNFMGLVPVMMTRILTSPILSSTNLSSLETVFHAGAHCPETVKRAWLDMVGPERLIEAYGSTEGIGATIIDGREWLDHPGSVGRPVGCQLKILDEGQLEV